MIKFELNQQKGRLPLQAKLTKLEKIISGEFKQNGNISIALVDDKMSRILNKSYRNKTKSANVLTFVYNDEDSIGEIVLAYNRLKQYAKENKKTIADAAVELIVHGACHIFGYTHGSRAAALKMEVREEKIKKVFYGKKSFKRKL